MTYTIVARDPKTNALGIASATGNLAVGGFVPHLKPGIGVIATQGFSTNYWYGINGLTLLESGKRADSVRDELINADDGRQWRQLLVLDDNGETAAWTGDKNRAETTHLVERDLVLGGNMLSHPNVPSVMRDRFHAMAQTSQRFDLCLLESLVAGFDAGGDVRGTTSAMIKVVYPNALPLDLRVDDHPHPMTELQRLYDMTRDPEYRMFFDRLPTPDKPHQY
ncbi:DUF1028 domain-containing protein [Thalassospira lucentensis]|uniref:DUF1028 domain-containing protein n=1 Tax=Thalassospira lucentensis TaxID=168935 RepID=A0A358HQW5_9PROT|nr:DUF1028 domain-containing protein [Thalassospira lucentensis]HBU97577.1 DUF1028 domain-containing protein [Thalassospira lucentensis]HCW67345.1 DUF1028 domain-containing protein [Thalassospira lucentensis]|tara:strand:- start:472 stop:1137 length:666 start_codon:yes stop_codon:yes gene_type:complete